MVGFLVELCVGFVYYCCFCLKKVSSLEYRLMASNHKVIRECSFRKKDWL